MRRALGALFLVACTHHARRPPPAAFDASTPPRPVLYDVIVPKRSAPGGNVSGQTTCGTSMVMHERRGASTRVTAGDDEFWVDDADLDRAPHAYVHCHGPIMTRDARVSDALAHSLTPPVLVEADPWEDFDPTLPKSIYERDEGNTSCVEFRFQGDKLVATSAIWGFERNDDRNVTLTGPTILNAKLADDQWHLLPAAGEKVGYLCSKPLFMARRGPDAWDLVTTVNPGARGDIWAYSPAIAERWYATRAACEKGLRRGAVAKLPFSGCM